MTKINWNILDKNKKYLLAVSGGVDSCSLYQLLNENGYDFCVVHINHHTRGSENACEQLLVEKMCRDDQRQCFVAHYYAPKTGNFHQLARQFRLNIYQKIVQGLGLDGIILAHHLDDNVENLYISKHAILPQLMQPVSRYKDLVIYRPMLDVSKENIYSYAQNSGIIWYEDSSNAKNDYLRNFYRHKLALTLSEKECLINEAQQKMKLAKRYYSLALSKHNYLHASDKNVYLHTTLRRLTNQSISHKQVLDLISLIDFHGFKKYHLKGGFYFYQIYDQLMVLPTDLEKFSWDISVDNKKYRCSRSDDVILDNGTNKKVSQILKKRKIPQIFRKYWPVILDNNGNICYIPNIDEVIIKEHNGE